MNQYVNPHRFSASCQGHFGELLQGIFLSEHNIPVRGLVTFPCPQLLSRASLEFGSELINNQTTRPSPRHIKANPSGNPVTDPEKPKVRRIIAIYCRHYSLPSAFKLSITSNIPVAVGMGSSTADLVATIRVLDKAFNLQTNDETLLQMVLQVEKACDPTLFSDNALLFAQRRGKVLEDFAYPLPTMHILEFDLMPGERFITDEVAPADYRDEDIAEFEQLRKRIRMAIQTQNVPEIAQVATQSALINQRYFPKDKLDEMLNLQEKLRALGVCIAHSGTVGGLIFSGAQPDSTLLQSHKSLLRSYVYSAPN